ncbi:MAG: CopG family transcriptional regulator [Bacteroidetes bacterium]|jgi:putative iron-only hydrogenase system regulator|nr:CopG family transcriptional regulator [Bacteroidota bacterium]MBT3747810.1 CopG family transcriptional regulator [Bacteroidota bacterium]MBT4401521.1 CopG family transcriptional regulator [Bacteroidota bacterium]MBT4411139.1 CopG family transcriptional regulator [Bacteroidota bacterium]MBT5426060.1 CopG family transcriptional regulator [Bacteroidota bacterium]
MEKRIGSVLILITDKSVAQALNNLISNYSEIIIARQGLPVHSTGDGIISLILEGTTDQISALTGQLGRVQGVVVKSVVLKLKNSNENF